MEYDFYYSPTHDQHSAKMAELYFPELHHDAFVNGIKYTEMIQSGRIPVTKHKFGNDLVKVFSGTLNNVKITTKNRS